MNSSAYSAVKRLRDNFRSQHVDCSLAVDRAAGFRIVWSWVLFSACLVSYGAAADSWPSFHNGGNTSIDARNLPATWTPEELAWKTELRGYGQSSPVIWKDLVYVTSTEGHEKEFCLLHALSLKSGEILWSKEFNASVRLKYGDMVSRAAPTPVVDEQGVYAFYESGDLVAFTHQGQERWRLALFDDAANKFENNHGYGGSPAQTNDTILLLVDHKGPSYLLAISKASGETVWKTDRTSRSSWSSPQVTRRATNQTQVIVSSGGTVDGYDSVSGKQLWTVEGLTGNTIPSATILDDFVFVGAAQGRGGAANAKTTSNCCLRLQPGDLPYETLWHTEKAVCSYVSPLVHAGHVYYVNNVGVVFCLDAFTGQQLYAERIDGPCWAQPIAVGDQIYFFCKNGLTTVIRSGASFERIASNRLWNDGAPIVRATETNAQAKEVVSEKESTGGENRAKQETLDPLVYAVAAVDGAFIVRLGTHVIRVGSPRVDVEQRSIGQ